MTKLHTLNMALTCDDLDAEADIAQAIDAHELARETLKKNDTVRIGFDNGDGTGELFVLRVTENSVHAKPEGKNVKMPNGASDLIFEDGFCHTGDAMDATKDIPVPDDLMEYNFMFAKKAERCGCAFCGKMFPGSKVKDCTRDSRGDFIGTAFCPECGMMAVIAEDDAVKVTDNNLWRWYRHAFGDAPMYRTHPRPAPKF